MTYYDVEDCRQPEQRVHHGKKIWHRKGYCGLLVGLQGMLLFDMERQRRDKLGHHNLAIKCIAK